MRLLCLLRNILNSFLGLVEKNSMVHHIEQAHHKKYDGTFRTVRFGPRYLLCVAADK